MGRSSPARLALLALVALGMAACSSDPTRRGESFYVTIVDANRVRLDGAIVSWEALDAHARERVRSAREKGAGKPHVDFDAMSGVTADLTNRMIDLLHAAGIRSIEIHPVRR